VLKSFLALRLEIEMFMVNEKGEVMAGLNDENTLWNLTLLCDIDHHLNDLNNKTEAQQNLIW
jgi:hypothetical protein